MSDPVRFTRRYLEERKATLEPENARLREALELAQNLVPPAFHAARERIATALHRAPTNERNEADMRPHNVQVKNTGIACTAESLSEGSTVQGSDKLGTNSEPHRNHSQPHSGPIEPRLSVTPKVVPVLLPFRIATLDVDPEAEARIDTLMAAQRAEGEGMRQQMERRFEAMKPLPLTPYGNLLRQDEVRMVHDAAYAHALEEAAKVAEEVGRRWLGRGAAAFAEVATAIRALKDKP